MPRTFGEWLFLAGIGVFCILGVMNGLVAGICLFGSIVMGEQYGFDRAIVVGIVFFGVLFFGETVNALLAKPEKILKSALPNVLAVTVRLIWLLFAAFLFYGLYIDGGLVATKHPFIYLILAVLVVLANAPSMVFHAVLCCGKWRKSLLETYEDLQQQGIKANRERGTQ